MQLGSGRVDVLAVEPTGRPVVIEVKLRDNTESRRAVVAQVLAYAATLHGQYRRGVRVRRPRHSSPGPHDVVREAVQTQDPDAATCHATLDAALLDGAMRVVLVLVDRAPQELIRLVGFLEAVTPGLVMVASSELGGRRFVVPRRPERRAGGERGPTLLRPAGVAVCACRRSSGAAVVALGPRAARPGSIEAVSTAGGAEIGRGTLAPVVDQAVPDAVYAAHVEASG